MLSGLERHFPSDVAWTRPQGGLFVWVTMPDTVDGDELFVAAGRAGVSFSCGSLFHLEGRGRNTLRLAYASVEPARIEEGLKLLGGLIAERLAEPERRPAGGVERTLPVL